jgi:hypothetical protein
MFGTSRCIAATTGATKTIGPEVFRARWAAAQRRATTSGVGLMPSTGSASHAGKRATAPSPRKARAPAARRSASLGPGASRRTGDLAALVRPEAT